VTALLEYLNLAFTTCSWFSHYNSLDRDSVLHHWRALQSWLIHPHTNFESILQNGLSGRSGILLVILDCTIITHCWFICCIFMIFSLISLKPQKVWALIVNLPLYKFSPFTVYPVGVITYWCYFLWIIANNFASVYHILTKLDTKMCPYTTFLCAKFQENQITHFHFTVTVPPLQKMIKKNKRFLKKNKETKPIFGSSYLGKA